MKKYILFLIFYIISLSGCSTKHELIILKEAPKYDNTLFEKVIGVVQSYKSNLQWNNLCSFEIDRVNGIIESNWHPVHKGEVQRKIEIYVWGTTHHIDVWHKNTIGFSSAHKGYVSRLVEMKFNLDIQKK